MLPNLKFSYYNFFIPHQKENIYIVYNSLSNSMIQLDWKIGSYLSQLNSTEIHFIDEEVIRLLQEHNMIIPSDCDEFSIIQKRSNNKRESFKEDENLFILFTPTNMCNMNCPYCYQGDKSLTVVLEKSMNENNITAAKEFISNRVSELNGTLKNIHIKWFGGEPLLYQNIISELSEFAMNKAEEFNLGYNASIITNGYLLNESTWSLLDKYKIYELQITLDGNEEMHNSMRSLKSGKGSYQTILNNISLMPSENFKVVIRINGDKEVYSTIFNLFNDFSRENLWPQRADQISFHWAPKFYDIEGNTQDKSRYYTGYEYHKSREDFAILRLKKYNEWARVNNKKNKRLIVAYPESSSYYCNTVESPNSFCLDSKGYIHKCFNTVNDKEKRIEHVSYYNKNNEHLAYYKQLDKTLLSDCNSCKVLPICQESCNKRLLENTESKICSPWKYFMEERMKKIYDHKFQNKRN